jgi:hypothetical protein
VYVCDRLVLPTVRDRIDEIAAGRFPLDEAIREYVRAGLDFRMVQVSDGREALQVDASKKVLTLRRGRKADGSIGIQQGQPSGRVGYPLCNSGQLADFLKDAPKTWFWSHAHGSIRVQEGSQTAPPALGSGFHCKPESSTATTSPLGCAHLLALLTNRLSPPGPP